MNKNEITIIARGSSWYRPYNVNGKDLEKIVIYKDGEIIIKTRSGWLEETDENFRPKYLGDVLQLQIDGTIKRANKLNLNRKDNFLFREKDQYSIRDGITLYIYADNIFSNYIELPKKYDDLKTGKHYLYGYKVQLKYPFKQDELYFKYYKKGDEIEKQDRLRDFRNPVLRDENGKPKKDENGKYLYDENLSYVSRVREIETTKEIIIYNGLYLKEGK